MGWNNSPPFFCTTKETVADLENQAICAHAPSRPHNLDNRSAAFVSTTSPTLYSTRVPLSRYPLLLRTNTQLFSYVDVFVDYFLGLAQGPTHRRHHVRRTLFHSLEKVLRPLDKLEPTQRKELPSLKKIDAGEYSWSTCKVLLSWVVDTVNMTLSLPTH